MKGLFKKTKKQEYNSYRCNVCNTAFSAPHGFLNLSCVCCSSKNVTRLESISYADYKVLPFIDTLKDARDKYRSMIRYNPIIPGVFRRKKTILGMKKFYLPCMLYSANVSGDVKFLGTDKIKNVKTLPNATFEIGFKSNMDFNNILVNGFKNVSSELLDSICDYNYSVLEDFDNQNSKECYLAVVDEDINNMNYNVNEQILKCATGIIRSNVEHALKKVNSNNLKVKFTMIQKVLVPVYLLKVTYHKKDYYFIMNGQTGNATIDLVSSKGIIALFTIISFVVLMAIFAYISLML